jgi:hypothetical protein
MHATGRQIVIWIAIRIGWINHQRRRAIREAVRTRMRGSKLVPEALFTLQALPLQRTPRQVCRRALRGKAICVRRA